ncbi:MAG: SufE family protein [Proteobacteria bacterium]|nr:SufE family protein [Pseudomonadota bacterium]
MSTIAQDLDDLAEDFDLLGDWEEQLQYVLELGRALPDLPEAERTEANKVRGCASQVWVVAERDPDGRLIFRADSDAQIPRGLIAVLLRLYSGRTPEEIRATDPQVAVQRLKLESMLTSQRANGLAAMVERIRREAAA